MKTVTRRTVTQLRSGQLVYRPLLSGDTAGTIRVFRLEAGAHGHVYEVEALSDSMVPDLYLLTANFGRPPIRIEVDNVESTPIFIDEKDALEYALPLLRQRREQATLGEERITKRMKELQIKVPGQKKAEKARA